MTEQQYPFVWWITKEEALERWPMTNHKPGCGFHLDQYAWECDCGAVKARPGIRYFTEDETAEFRRLQEVDRLWAAVVASARGC